LGTNLAIASGHELQQAVTALSDSSSSAERQSMLVVRPREDRDLLKLICIISAGHNGSVRKMQNESENVELTQAEDDVRQLAQHIADQQIRIKVLQAAGHVDDEMKAREGLFLLSDALEIARRRLEVERHVRGKLL
jgi:hypothetical protein